MSRAKRILEMMDGECPPCPNQAPDITTVGVSSAGDPPHTHQLEINEDGSGRLYEASTGEEHEHEIIDWEVQSSGTYPHIHDIKKQEIVAPPTDATPSAHDIFKELPIVKALDALGVGENVDKEWDDEISDTKEKVKVSVTKDAPHIRRVFDKKGKYIGSFDTKNTTDKTKYKTMMKGGR